MADLITTAELAASCPTLAGRPDIQLLASAASKAVERHCGRTFAQEALTEYHDGTGRPRLWLRRRPVASVSAVSIDGDALDNAAAEAWTFDPDTGELVRGAGLTATEFAPLFPWGKRNVVVGYTAGYAAIPEDVKAAAILVAKWLADRTGASGASGAYQSESIGDYSYAIAAQSDPIVATGADALLATYLGDPVL